MKALIEADEVVYSAGFATEHTIYRVYMKGEEGDGWVASFRYKKPMVEWLTTWNLSEETSEYEGDVVVIKEKEVQSLHLALYNARSYIDTILKQSKADTYCLYFSGKNNIRTSIANTLPYKGNRDPTHKPFHYKSIKEFLLKNYTHEIMEGLEADDGPSIEQWGAWNAGQLDDTIICSKDKDLNLVPGWHYNPQRKERYKLNNHEACINFYHQLLIGDMTDNIPSVKHFTHLTRLKTKKWREDLSEMEGEMDMFEYVNEIYDGQIEAMEEVGNLIWMRQHKDQVYEPGEMYYGI